jgi:hypothetical protein
VDERSRVAAAERLMAGFADATGLSGGRPPQRYLWTDAYAVCNFIALDRRLPGRDYLGLAVALVDQVHAVLGRFDEKDSRTGWISCLSDAEADHHPTAGGLRIGKPMLERRDDERYDPDLEWDRDGQYFHYLTKWAHALIRLAEATDQPRLRIWSTELMTHAVAAFRGPHGGLYWKMSVDLSRPLVTAQGAHDALDGYITMLTLHEKAPSPRLETVATDLKAYADGSGWTTGDPLGIGGLLFDAARVASLSKPPPELLVRLLEAAALGLRGYLGQRSLAQPPEFRLPFRELGLSIGLHAAEHVDRTIPRGTIPVLDRLNEHFSLADAIEQFWLDPTHHVGTWHDHLDINRVMLATSLLPTGLFHPTPSQSRSCVSRS